MKKYFLFFALAGTVIFSSCDKVKDPYATTGTPVVPPPAGMVRKVLIEEFTGHKCPNCPLGALAMHACQHDFPGQVIGVVIHNAIPFSNPQTAPYVENFQTTVGNGYYNTTFQPGSYPTGMVNRIGFPAHLQVLSQTVWHDSVSSLLTKAPDAYLTITNNYNAGSRLLTSTVKCKFLHPLGSTYKLVLLLTEDSIVAPQTNLLNSQAADPAYPSPDALQYVHMHMLRAIIDGSTGSGIAIAPVYTADSTVTPTAFTYTLPATYPVTPPASQQTVPNPANCHVVAFIYDDVTMEVVQAEESSPIQ